MILVALAAACGGDAASVAEREALLSEAPEASEATEDPALERSLAALDERTDLTAGERLRERYRLIDERIASEASAEELPEAAADRLERSGALRRYVTDESVSERDLAELEAEIREGMAREPITDDDRAASEATYDALRVLGFETDSTREGRAER